MRYNKEYYSNNSQDGDRPALIMYEKLWRKYSGVGPVLEFGCGVGHFAKRLSKHAKVYGVETNTYALSAARQIAPKAKFLESMRDIPDNHLSSIVALHVFEHIEDALLVNIFQEMNCKLTVNGTVIAVMPNKFGGAHILKGKDWKAFSDPTHLNIKSAQEWENMFKTVWGLSIISSFSDGYYDFPYATKRKYFFPFLIYADYCAP
jgi:SAM-dependent methyltransferase